jgi:hypothetical protein
VHPASPAHHRYEALRWSGRGLRVVVQFVVHAFEPGQFLQPAVTGLATTSPPC